MESEARRRIVDSAYDLFARRGIQAVGVDEVIRNAGVAKATLNVLLELGPGHPAGEACVTHLENIRGVVRMLAEEAGLRDTNDFARSWHILMKGSIVSAAEGDRDAARRAQLMARELIDRHS
jgi:hypothetical protein